MIQRKVSSSLRPFVCLLPPNWFGSAFHFVHQQKLSLLFSVLFLLRPFSSLFSCLFCSVLVFLVPSNCKLPDSINGGLPTFLPFQANQQLFLDEPCLLLSFLLHEEHRTNNSASHFCWNKVWRYKGTFIDEQARTFQKTFVINNTEYI